MFKKLLTLAAVALPLSMSAQVSVSEPVLKSYIPVSQTKAVKTVSKIEPAANQAWWGYVTGDEKRSGLGIGSTGSLDAAIFIPGTNAAIVGKTIKAVRFYLRDKSVLSDFKLWLSKEKPANGAAADVTVMNIDLATLDGGDVADDNLGKVNDVELTNPYVITSEGVYVGYSFKVTSASGSAGKYPWCVVEGDAPNGLFAGWGEGLIDFSTDGYGKLAVQVLLEGNFIECGATPQDFGTVGTAVGYATSVDVEIHNVGQQAISNIDYTVSIDGVTGAEQHATFSTPIAFGQSDQFKVPFAAYNEAGNHSVVVTVTKVNGVVNGAEDKIGEGSLNIVADLFPRNVVIEEFTTEKCPNCPRVAGFLHTYLEGADRSRVYAVCHHSAYYTDWLTLPCDEELTYLYNDYYQGQQVTYAPGVMYNRQPYFESAYPESSQNNMDNVSLPGSANEIKTIVDSELGKLSNLFLSMNVAPNADTTQVVLTITGKCNDAFNKDKGLLTVYATEDDIKAQSQSGASGTYYHQHVIRYYNSTWGDNITWNGNQFTATYTVPMESTWVKNKMWFVAFVNKHNATNRLDNMIENSIGAQFFNPNGIEGVTTDGENVKMTDFYTVDGRQISAPQKGINIIKMSDGTTKKVVIK